MSRFSDDKAIFLKKLENISCFLGEGALVSLLGILIMSALGFKDMVDPSPACFPTQFYSANRQLVRTKLYSLNFTANSGKRLEWRFQSNRSVRKSTHSLKWTAEKPEQNPKLTANVSTITCCFLLGILLQ